MFAFLTCTVADVFGKKNNLPKRIFFLNCPHKLHILTVIKIRKTFLSFTWTASLAPLFTKLLDQFSWYFVQAVTYLANALCCRIVLQTVIATLYFLLWRRRLTYPVTNFLYHHTFHIMYLLFVWLFHLLN